MLNRTTEARNIRKKYLIIVGIASFGLSVAIGMAARSRTTANESMQDVMARNPELHNQLIDESMRRPAERRRESYNPMDMIREDKRDTPERLDMLRAQVPIHILESAKNWFPLRPEELGPTTDRSDVDSSSTWICTDGEFAKLRLGWGDDPERANTPYTAATTARSIQTPLKERNLDEFGLGEAGLIAEQVPSGLTQIGGYRGLGVAVSIRMSWDIKNQKWHRELNAQDRDLAWKLARLCLAYRVTQASSKVETGIVFNRGADVAKFSRVRSLRTWTAIDSDSYSKRFSVESHQVELVAGACKARVDGKMVKLNHIIAADNENWYIAEDDVALLGNL